jgi:hypothetical protein
MTRTDLASTTRTSAAADTGVDISGITGDWTIVIEILDLHSASGTPSVRIAIQDSVDTFSNNLPGPAVCVSGTVTTGATKRYSFKKADFPNLRFGTGSATLRTNVAQLLGTSPSITYHAYFEY